MLKLGRCSVIQNFFLIENHYHKNRSGSVPGVEVSLHCIAQLSDSFAMSLLPQPGPSLSVWSCLE